MSLCVKGAMNQNNVQHLIIDALPASDPSWVEFLSALLVPLIAIIGAFIAYQQYRINQQRLRHETYEHRLAVYKAIQRYLSEVIRDGKTSYERALQFNAEASEAFFLFDSSVQERIDLIYKKSIRMEYLNKKMNTGNKGNPMPVGEERSKVVEEESELLKWHADELVAIRPFFAKKLGLKIT